MSKGFKIVMIAVMGLVLTGCPPHCDYVEYDFGMLTQEALDLVPYDDGKTYSLSHSEGHKITFFCQRQSSIERSYMDPCGSMVYEQNLCILNPDYPIFDLSITIRKWDTLNYSVQAYIGQSSFLLPLNHDYGMEYSYFDSLRLDENWYRDVYAIKRNTNSYNEPSGIYPDSLWYNTAKGVLKVGMSNYEFYQIVQNNE